MLLYGNIDEPVNAFCGKATQKRDQPIISWLTQPEKIVWDAAALLLLVILSSGNF